MMRETFKSVARGLATIVMIPAMCSFYARALILGRDRALEGSTQVLSLIPGLPGQYLRRAFLSRTLAFFASSAVVEFGTIFSAVGTRVDANAYIGPNCHVGLVHFERDTLIAPGVQIPSGGSVHGAGDLTVPIRDQPGVHVLVRIGEGAWIGASAVVMADVGRGTIVGAGAVVTKPLPDNVVAGGVPARVLRARGAS